MDFDVHHGNGTQDIFFDNKNVYIYTSIPILSVAGSDKEIGKESTYMAIRATGTTRGIFKCFNLP